MPFQTHHIHSSDAVGTYFDLTSVILHLKELLFCCNWSKSQSEPSVSQAHTHIALGPAMSLEGAYGYGTTIYHCHLFLVQTGR